MFFYVLAAVLQEYKVVITENLLAFATFFNTCIVFLYEKMYEKSPVSRASFGVKNEVFMEIVTCFFACDERKV